MRVLASFGNSASASTGVKITPEHERKQTLQNGKRERNRTPRKNKGVREFRAIAFHT